MAFILVGTGGLMFRHQVHEYLDIREQARIQAELKLAMQSMTLEIANAGALLPNPLTSFSAQPASLAFGYLDLTGRSCPAGSTAVVAFRTATAGKTDRIEESITCNGRRQPVQILATAPRGMLNLSFNYYDRNGAVTRVSNQIKAVDLRIALKAAGPKAGKTYAKTRAQTVRIQCVNL